MNSFLNVKDKDLVARIFPINQVLNHTISEVEQFLGSPDKWALRGEYELRDYGFEDYRIDIGFNSRKIAVSANYHLERREITDIETAMSLLGIKMDGVKKIEKSSFQRETCYIDQEQQLRIYVRSGKLRSVIQVDVLSYVSEFGQLFQNLLDLAQIHSTNLISKEELAILVAQRLGYDISPTLIDMWSIGKRPPSLEVVLALIKVFYELGSIENIDIARSFTRAAGYSFFDPEIELQLIRGVMLLDNEFPKSANQLIN